MFNCGDFSFFFKLSIVLTSYLQLLIKQDVDTIQTFTEVYISILFSLLGKNKGQEREGTDVLLCKRGYRFLSPT